MTTLTLNNENQQQSLLEFIKSELTSSGNLSIRGLANLCGIDHTALIRGGDFKSEKLGQILTSNSFQAGDLVDNGFNAKASWLVIEYFAYDSKAEAPGAKQIARTFGQVGIMTTFDQLNSQIQQAMGDKPTLDLIADASKLAEIAYGKSYQQRYICQKVEKYYPQLALTCVANEEKASLTTKALLTPTDIAEKLDILYKSDKPNPRRVNELLTDYGYQNALRDSKNKLHYEATQLAISQNLCDRKPVDTNSRTQKDQLLWSSEIVEVLRQHLAA